jgi:hypothetical protein
MRNRVTHPGPKNPISGHVIRSGGFLSPVPIFSGLGHSQQQKSNVGLSTIASR